MNYSILRCICYVPERKMAPVPRTMLLCCIVVAFVSAVFPADGADLLQAGDLHITFPGTDWKQADPPAELQRSYQISPSNVRLIFHATSTSAQLRFHIVEVDFSGLEATNKPIAIAGLLDGVKRRCQRQASGAIHETNASSGEIHFTEFAADLPGGLFLKIRNLLCSDKVYLLEIGGPKDSRAEADEVIAGVLVGESKALASQAAKSVSEIRRSPPISPERRAYERGRRIGYAFAIVMVVGVVVVVLVLILKSLASKRVRPRDGSPAVPPPLPPSAKG